MKATEVHIYGFDSIFEMDLTSFTDLLLESDRSTQNTVRLNDNWRHVWVGMFNEFKDVTFHLYHNHSDIKFSVPDNVKINVITKNLLTLTTDCVII